MSRLLLPFGEMSRAKYPKLPTSITTRFAVFQIYVYINENGLNETEFSTAKTTDPYDTYWWLAPRYFQELASRPKYLVAIE